MALDQQPAVVFAVEIIWAIDGFHFPFTRPVAGEIEHGLEDIVILDHFDEVVHALRVPPCPRVVVIFRQAERANRLAILPGDEELGGPVLEEHAAFRVDGFFALREQRRDPERIVLVDAPGEGQEKSLFAFCDDFPHLNGHQSALRTSTFFQPLSDLGIFTAPKRVHNRKDNSCQQQYQPG